jgi:predicted hydrocarbon binding protein
MDNALRPTLGSFMHAVCFQYLRIYTEEVAGRAPIVAAGRKRGYDVIEELGMLGSTQDAAQIKAKIAPILGEQGTRLCNLEQVTARPDGGYELQITESACTAGQRSSEPLCAYTLGVFVGALHALTGTRMTGREVKCQACGESACTYIIEPVQLL